MASSSSQSNGEQKKTEQIPAEPGKRDKVVLFVLLALLAGFTLTISDYSLISMRLLSAGVLVLAACYLLSGIRGAIYWNLTFICPLLMACYGVWQTRWSDQKIVYNGWERTLYWFTLAMVAMVATQLFEKRGLARTFRVSLCGFGSGMALLDVLQQASHTGNYFWLIPSGFPDIYGTFPYYNNLV